MMFIFLLILFIVLVGGGYSIGKSIGNTLFPDEKTTYIDRSVHHHYHEHKSINIIDEETRKKVFELREKKVK
jgi:hypothetical protein